MLSFLNTTSKNCSGEGSLISHYPHPSLGFSERNSQNLREHSMFENARVKAGGRKQIFAFKGEVSTNEPRVYATSFHGHYHLLLTLVTCRHL